MTNISSVDKISRLDWLIKTKKLGVMITDLGKKREKFSITKLIFVYVSFPMCFEWAQLLHVLWLSFFFFFLFSDRQYVNPPIPPFTPPGYMLLTLNNILIEHKKQFLPTNYDMHHWPWRYFSKYECVKIEILYSFFFFFYLRRKHHFLGDTKLDLCTY